MIENTIGNMNEIMHEQNAQPIGTTAETSAVPVAPEQTATGYAGEEEKIRPIAPTAQEANNEYLIELKKPYCWEGREYTQIDLSGLERLTIRDAIDALKRLFNDGEAAAAMLCETTTAFAREIAQKATGKPIEFFKFMPVRVAKAVTTEVQSFIASRSDDASKLVLEHPYIYNGKSYKEIAIDGLRDLNSLNMSEAENALTREGFIITATQFNYLYACVLLGMATGLATEFFTELPLSELLNVKNAANNSDFFE